MYIYVDSWSFPNNSIIRTMPKTIHEFVWRGFNNVASFPLYFFTETDDESFSWEDNGYVDLPSQSTTSRPLQTGERIICMNCGSRSKSTNYMSWWSSRRSNGLYWSCTSEKGPRKGIIENQEIRRSVSQRRMPRETEKPPLTMMKSQLMEQVPARKIKTYMVWWSLRIFLIGVLYIHFPNPDDELKIFFVKMVMEW